MAVGLGGHAIATKIGVGDLLREAWSYRSSVRLLCGHQVPIVLAVLLWEVAGLGHLRDAAHLRWRSEGTANVRVARLRRPGWS